MEDTMNSEQEAQKEETEATEEKSPAGELQVPLHDVTKLRTRAQTAELEVANLRGQLTQLQTVAAPAPVQSPLEIEVARQTAEGIDEEDMTITPKIYRAQQAFDKQQAEQAAATEAAQTRQAAQIASTNAAIAAHPDWREVVKSGFAHMTKGEMLDIESQVDGFGELAYTKAKQVLERVKPAPEQSKSEAAEKATADKAAADKAAGVTPTQAEILATVDAVTARAALL